MLDRFEFEGVVEQDSRGAECVYLPREVRLGVTHTYVVKVFVKVTIIEDDPTS